MRAEEELAQLKKELAAERAKTAGSEPFAALHI